LIYLGWSLSKQGKASGIEEIETGLRGAHQIGAGRLQPFHLSLAADAYSNAGRHDKARAAIAEAVTALTRGSDLALAAEIYRMRAVLLLSADAGQHETAEADLHHALEIARSQESPSLQLRAASDLARLLAERGERQEAADLLAPIYGWFSEGFCMPDLKEAKTLLNELGA
jgi:predicted ATPase